MMRRLMLFAVSLCLAGCAVGDRPGPLSPPAPGTPVVVTLGDSVPAGTACGCTPFPDLYARMLSPHARSLNLAQPGYTVGDVEDQLGDDRVRDNLGSATVVLVMAGANDMAGVFGDGDDAFPPAAEKVRTAMATILTAVHQAHAAPIRIVVLGYWNVVKDGPVGLAAYGPDGVRSAQRATRYGNDALRAAAEQSGDVYLTTTPAIEEEGSGGAGRLAPDGDHPNASGHEAIAAAIYAAAPTG
ncbi:SGNH/GDSL hydrolase family protein [Actinoplanes sp. NPDC049316]|uniref:SGNH/GDSL hydrolase family protein n=1 Tax=Actinoplanes sp. NPDC049316 TaxID=3154727 RepID=UPI003439AA52